MNEFSLLKNPAEVGDADLPEEIRAAIAAEDARVKTEILDPRRLEERRILVVGGGGYIGVPLTGHLLERGYRVRCLDLFLYGNRDSVTQFLGHPRYDIVVGDHGNARLADKALDGVTDVIVLAGLVGDPITKKYPDEHRAVNEDGLERFIAGLDGRGLNKVIFVSTCSNYGEIPANATADENYALKPLSLYAKAKVARERELLSFENKVDYTGTILRFATAFGLSGRMRFDLTISEFTRELFSGAELEVYDADTWRPYCHVQDFARALTRVLEFPRDRVHFEVFNAGGDANNFTKKMIVEAVQAQIETGKVVYVDGGVDRRNYRVDFKKIRDVLLFEPLYTVPDGITELIAVMRQGFFTDYAERLNFYRNNEIDYRAA